jgi:hypothetical protein
MGVAMKVKTAFIIMFLLIGISLILAIVSSALIKEVPFEKKDNSTMAYIMMKGFVKDTLKAPSTAVFPDINDVKITKKDTLYSITGYVDAQNSFGAMLRTSYIGEIKQTDKDKWSLVSLNLTN